LHNFNFLSYDKIIQDYQQINQDFAMKRYLVCFLVFFGVQLFAAEAPLTPQIDWYTNYADALKASQSTSKPIVLFFTGSDWCTWCNKLEKEALQTPDFINRVGDKLIFVKLDYPRKGNANADIVAQNAELLKKYSVHGYPTLILINPQEQQIGITGYRPGGGQDYADHLLKMVNEYSDYKNKMSRLDNTEYNGKDLKRLYQQSQELGLKADSAHIIERGIQSDLPHFFLAEQYRSLVKQGKSQDQNTAELKHKLLESDPNNANLIHYQVAVIDFEESSEKMCQGKCTPDTCVKPLLTYLKKFGPDDKQNEWRLNMIISQTYLDKNRFKEALRYANTAMATAPDNMKPEIASSITSIESRL
jgi:protein disulfide-isomerase